MSNCLCPTLRWCEGSDQGLRPGGLRVQLSGGRGVSDAHPPLDVLGDEVFTYNNQILFIRWYISWFEVSVSCWLVRVDVYDGLKLRGCGVLGERTCHQSTGGLLLLVWLCLQTPPPCWLRGGSESSTLPVLEGPDDVLVRTILKHFIYFTFGLTARMDHTTVTAPLPVCSAKLSTVGSS